MITTITDQQWADLAAYREEWYQIGSACGPTDREATTAVIIKLYAALEKPPPLFVYLSSPLSCLRAYGILNKPLAAGQLHAQLDDQLYAQLNAQLRARSDAAPDRSLVPIRVLSTPIARGMAFLRTVHDTEACPHKHRLLRLCPQCVAHWLAAQE